MPLRLMPQIEAPVTVHCLAAVSSATIAEVSPDGRRIAVVTDEGERLHFALNPATATFTTRGPGGARLVFG